VHPKNPPRVVKHHPKGLVPQSPLVPHNCSSTSPSPPSSPAISTPPLSPIPTSPSVTWSLQNKEAHKPLDITKIPGSPHKLPKDFKEWLPIFSGEDLTAPEDHLYLFLRSLESCDQHEDILMKLFSYTFVGKAKDWFDNIFPRNNHKLEFLSGTFYQKIRKKRDYQSLCNQLHKCKRKSGEDIRDFNDRFNTLVRCFPQELKPPKASILKLYISTMKDLYGALIREHPTTLFEAQERACEIEENLATSLIQEEENPKETLQINQIDDFVSPELPSDVRTYLQEEREKATEREACLMINLLEEERERNIRKNTSPTK
jgi:hypothetical protein